MKTVRLTGNTAPVDSECTEMVGKAQVYKEGSDIYDAMLNQVRMILDQGFSTCGPRGNTLWAAKSF